MALISNRVANSIERSTDTNPADATESLKITPIAVPNPGRRRKRA
jgi:hypothetical protein